MPVSRVFASAAPKKRSASVCLAEAGGEARRDLERALANGHRACLSGNGDDFAEALPRHVCAPRAT